MIKKTRVKVSPSVIRRLPRYRRRLTELLDKGVTRISSKELSQITGFTASQIRQDLNNFGGFGQQGYGYNVQDLYEEVGRILGLDKEYDVILAGFGNLGQAIANYTYFNKIGFKICGIFDVNPDIIGKRINDIEVMDYDSLDAYLAAHSIDIGIIATDKNSAQDVADKLSKGNVRGIWNFASVDLIVPEEVVLENVHLSDSLYTLAYYINQNVKPPEKKTEGQVK